MMCITPFIPFGLIWVVMLVVLFALQLILGVIRWLAAASCDDKNNE